MLKLPAPTGTIEERIDNFINESLTRDVKSEWNLKPGGFRYHKIKRVLESHRKNVDILTRAIGKAPVHFVLPDLYFFNLIHQYIIEAVGGDYSTISDDDLIDVRHYYRYSFNRIEQWDKKSKEYDNNSIKDLEQLNQLFNQAAKFKQSEQKGDENLLHDSIECIIRTEEGLMLSQGGESKDSMVIIDKDGNRNLFGSPHHRIGSLLTKVVSGIEVLPAWNKKGEDKYYDLYTIDGQQFYDENTVRLNQTICRDGKFYGPHYWIERVLETEVGKILVVKENSGDPGFNFRSEDKRRHWFGGFTTGLDIKEADVDDISLSDSIIVRDSKHFLKKWKSDPEFNNELNRGRGFKKKIVEFYYSDLHNFVFRNETELDDFLSTRWDKYRKTYDYIRRWKEGCEFPSSYVQSRAVEIIHDRDWLRRTEELFDVSRYEFLDKLRPDMNESFLDDWFDRIFKRYPHLDMDKRTFFYETVDSLRHVHGGNEDNYWRILEHNIEQSKVGGRVNSLWDMVEAANENIPDYEVLQYLGKGAFKSVYLVQSTISEMMLAFKKIDPSSLGKDLILKRFNSFEDWLESELYIKELKDIDSPYVSKVQEPKKILKKPDTMIIPGFELPYHNFYFYLVEEPFRMTLEEKLNDGPLSLEESLNRALHMTTGLYFCHQKGVIHRDLKPSNVGIGYDDITKLTDFGSLKRLVRKEGESELTSIAYSPPNINEGEEVDMSANMYSIGIMLWEMVSGRNPFIPDTPKPKGSGAEKDRYNEQIKENIKAFYKKSLKERNEYIKDDLDVGDSYIHRAISAIITAATSEKSVYTGLDDLRRDIAGVMGQYRDKKEAIFTIAGIRDSENIDCGVGLKGDLSADIWEKVIGSELIGPLAIIDSYKDVMVPADYDFLRESIQNLLDRDKEVGYLKGGKQ